MSDALHLDLDGAWAGTHLVADSVELREWGRQLRFSAPSRLIAEFYDNVKPQLPPFLLYGSGDFHHLTALWIRNHDQPLVVVSFDNHPDWDVRPPKWACGAWINRALELQHVTKVSVWGCGNFECWWPGQLFGNRAAERHGRLEVHPWADDRPRSQQNRRGAIIRGNWQDRFHDFARQLAGQSVYVTIDIDCLVVAEAVTNWENGRFTTEDVRWGIETLRQHCNITGGDLCGAFSVPQYARRKQRFAAEWDHPKISVPSPAEIRERNFGTLGKLWPVLVES